MSSAEVQSEQWLDALAASAPAERIDALRRYGDPAELLSHLADESSRLASIDVSRAEASANVVAETAESLGLSAISARALRARARALSYAGRYDEALGACDEAMCRAESAGAMEEAGRARLASMHALTETGRLAEAIHTAESARALFSSIDRADLAARADINLGVVYQRQDEPAAAVQCFDRARLVLHDDDLTIGHLENNRGEALLALNDFSGAERAFRDAKDAFERAGADVTAAIAEGNLADLAARKGHLAEALAGFERARRRLERTQSPAHLARLLAEEADAKSMLGLPGEALRAYERALGELDRQGLALEAARARAGLGQLLVRLERLSGASTALAAAAVGFAELGHHTAQAKIDLVRAEIIAQHGRVSEARAMATRCLASLHDRPADAIVARLVLARLAMRSGELVHAEAELAAAIDAAMRFDIAPMLADLLATRATIATLCHRRAAAITDLRAAVAQIERLRGSLQFDHFRAAFFGDRARIYEQLVASLLEQPDADAIDEAFSMVERARGRTLLDHVSNQSPPAPYGSGISEGDGPVLHRLQDEAQRLQGELSALYNRLADDRRRQVDRRALMRWREDVHAREARLVDIESRIAAASPESPANASTAQRDDVAACLRPDEALVEYSVINGKLMAFVVTADRIQVHTALATCTAVDEAIQRVRFQIERALRPGATDGSRAAQRLAVARQALAGLYNLVWRPLAGTLRSFAHITVVPHGPLHLVPFHALHDGRQYLIEHASVTTELSASLMVQRRRDSRPDSGGPPLIVGVPDPALTHVDEEVAAVARALDVQTADCLSGDAATTSALTERIGDASVIHVACHGLFDPENPQGSGLKLADRWLNVRDIHALRMRPQLLVMSGCETGLNKVDAAEDVIGLVRAFTCAGARRMLVSLWRVQDESTAELMSAFYDNWRSRGLSPETCPHAWRSAQLALMQSRPHPAHWAPFAKVG